MHAHVIGDSDCEVSLVAYHTMEPQHRDERGKGRGTCCCIKGGVWTVGWHERVKSIRAPSPANWTRHNGNVRKYGLFTRNQDAKSNKHSYPERLCGQRSNIHAVCKTWHGTLCYVEKGSV
jgi:hypothetical protein